MSVKKYRVVVDEDLCIGAASCVVVAPTVFEMNDENKAIVLDPNDADAEPVYERWLELDDDGFENLLLSAQSCPVLAVFIYDESGEQLFPVL